MATRTTVCGECLWKIYLDCVILDNNFANGNYSALALTVITTAIAITTVVGRGNLSNAQASRRDREATDRPARRGRGPSIEE